MNNAKEINVKNRTYYFSDEVMNIKSLDPNKKDDEKHMIKKATPQQLV